MIPHDYKCSACGVHGVKLWRQSSVFADAVTLMCGDCTVRDQGHALDLSQSDQCWGRCPAIPDLAGSWWGYTSVPPEGCAWWKALPLRLTGEWPVKGGIERWVLYREWSRRGDYAGLLRVDYHSDPPRALVFVARGAQ